MRPISDSDAFSGGWQQEGRQQDGGVHLARGILTFTIADQLIAANHWYHNPVRSGLLNVLGE